jgi:hypothetical protein
MQEEHCALLPLTQLLDKPHRRPTPTETLSYLRRHANHRQGARALQLRVHRRSHKKRRAKSIVELEKEKAELLERVRYLRDYTLSAVHWMVSARYSG